MSKTPQPPDNKLDDKIYNAGIGLTIGISQTIIGYPLETLKTRSQLGLPFNYRNLYSGVKYQFIIASLSSSICYLTFDTTYNKTHNMMLSGLASGIISGLIINPLEIYKVRSQALATPSSPFPMTAFKYTMMRECLAITTYFSTYMKLKELQPDYTLLNGGLAGCASWCIGYPVDTVKTHRQTSSSASLRELWASGLLFRGFGICMVRAFVVNAINFYIYETLHTAQIVL